MRPRGLMATSQGHTMGMSHAEVMAMTGTMVTTTMIGAMAPMARMVSRITTMATGGMVTMEVTRIDIIRVMCVVTFVNKLKYVRDVLLSCIINI